VRRLSVVGSPGSGKSTIGRLLAAKLDAPFVELDAIFHQPHWADLPLEEFRSRVTAITTGDTWVIDGNYLGVRDLVWQRSDAVVWLDLPRRTVMSRVIRRTLRRALTRERLWNGNTEPLSNFYRWDPTMNIIRWTWVKYDDYQERYSSAAADPANSHLEFYRLRTAHDVAEFVSRLPEGGR
jgi:adenylate kinase family enzyme